jgi:hypothetical protein
VATIEEFEGATSLDEAGERLTTLLGIEQPLPLSVVNRALKDARFARYLVASRSSPHLLEMLLADPKNAEFEPQPEPATGALIGRAVAAFGRWARAGFTKVSDEDFERRFSACVACPHLTSSSDRLVYKLMPGRTDERICTACGCVASRKAMLPSENCPVEDVSRPGFSRWGEELR